MTQPTEEKLLTRQQAADYLRQKGCSVSYGTLGNMAANHNGRKGPPFYKDGNRALYTPTDLDLWRRKRLVRVE